MKKAFILFSVLSVAAFTISGVWLNTGSGESFRSGIRETLLKELVYVNPLPPGQVADAAYVLGGSQKALEFKYKTVSELYRNGAVEKIWILSRPGITEYSPELGTNLSNDEWSIRRLKNFGVPPEKVEVVELQEGFFGTLSEAEQISELVRQRGLKTLLLISQPFHTYRVYMCFKKFLPQEKFSFHVQSSNDSQRLFELAIEYFKMNVYDHLLLSSKKHEQGFPRG